MATTKKKIDLLNSELGDQIREALRAMEKDSAYKTQSSYTANGVAHPDNQMPFIEKHMNYLVKHSDVNPQHYLSNLRLILKIRP